jgi:precorrin-3B methylase
MVRCTLWHIAGVTANAERRWGGIAVTRAMDVVAAFADTEALLVIGNSETRVFVNKIANEGLITFRGLGVYPQVLG